MTYAEISEFLGISVQYSRDACSSGAGTLKAVRTHDSRSTRQFSTVSQFNREHHARDFVYQTLTPYRREATDSPVGNRHLNCYSRCGDARRQQPIPRRVSSNPTVLMPAPKMIVEIIDASIVLDRQSKPDVRNQFGNTDGTHKRQW